MAVGVPAVVGPGLGVAVRRPEEGRRPGGGTHGTLPSGVVDARDGRRRRGRLRKEPDRREETMRALVLTGEGANVEAAAAGLAEGLGAGGVKVEQLPLRQDGGPRGVSSYDLVCVVVKAEGLLGRNIHPDVEEGLRQLRGLGGRHVAAFVCPGPIGGEAALRRLMAALEREGAFVRDFEVLRSPQMARQSASRLLNLLSD